jgi:hypothetical protein
MEVYFFGLGCFRIWLILNHMSSTSYFQSNHEPVFWAMLRPLLTISTADGSGALLMRCGVILLMSVLSAGSFFDI